ncbi:DEAD/DEAH box helicase [Pseudoclavibacter sp. 13-3]|uniref:DEAD/DEAH box helicase n=1 Tax=Pseudoclavibacter sp. 13-3 TaxID=2901228 RepID=UPI001E354B0F|nr:DEAD/DEAH box helicase [Pseudoclavibacter sp. 13-3]MCD7100760.1 DEAD/DEAH box helicase [Pseudoclavibacter sp. 13-3]
MTTQKTFAELGVPAPLVSVLEADGKTEAFPIQADTLPDTLRGRDVLGRGKTGSGKTLAFSLPLVSRLAGELAGGKRRPGQPVALVLAPTRELATQIETVIEPLADAYDLRATTIFGGVKQQRQVSALKAGVDIVVACPGRLEDLMKQGFVSLDAVEITVLDEADHMADLGFLPAVTRILNATPKNGQRLLFSATLDNGIDKLANRFLHDPILHSVDEANSPVAKMTHHVFEVSSPDIKKAVVERLASGTGRRILFMRTKHHAKRLARQLTANGIPAVDLQGNLSQNARERNLAKFESGEVKVMVATDVAARGIDVPEVELVIHVDPPAEHKAYLHRSGRTARAGHQGDVVTICLPEQRRDLKGMLRQAKISVEPITVTAESPEVVELVGEAAPYVAPKPPETPEGNRRQGRGKSRRRRGDVQGSGQRDGSHESHGGRGHSSHGADSRGDRNSSDARGRRDDTRRDGGRAAESRGGRSRRSGDGIASTHGSRRRGGSSSSKQGGHRSGGAAQFSSKSGVGQLAGSRGKGGQRHGR